MKIPKKIAFLPLSALPGSPAGEDQHPVSLLQKAGIKAVREAKKLIQAGVEGIFLENTSDVPFYSAPVPTETVVSLSVLAAALQEILPVPLGIHVRHQDVRTALSIVAITGCDMIYVEDLQEMAFLMRERQRLHISCLVFAKWPQNSEIEAKELFMIYRDVHVWMTNQNVNEKKIKKDYFYQEINLDEINSRKFPKNLPQGLVFRGTVPEMLTAIRFFKKIKKRKNNKT